MPDSTRPKLSRDLSPQPIEEFIQQWQSAVDAGSADHFNQQFAEDVLWGSPFGAVAVGYEQIHAIHGRMFSSVPPVPGAVRYDIEHVLRPTGEVAIVYVRRVAQFRDANADSKRPGSFDELALLVLVQREDKWWLAAAQHVPDRRDVYSR